MTAPERPLLELEQVSAGEGRLDVLPGDVFLLCTDGLWEYLDDDVLDAASQRKVAVALFNRVWDLLDAGSGRSA
ncbi:MAG: hypothetical protein RL354_585, partial [Planctomycetota bacterium]